MTTYVLVPGAWICGWCWRRLAPLLRAVGHDIYTPTLTGLGERAHLAHPDIDLDTHIQDVVNVLEYEDLQRVVLIGHSYAGMVVTGVADRAPQRLAHVVYLDALVPDDGQSFFDFWSPEGRAAVEEEARLMGDGSRWPVPDDLRGLAGLTEADERWLRSRAVAHPLKTLSQPVQVVDPSAAEIPRTYILCMAEREGDPVPDLVERMCSQRGWRLRRLATGHWPMISMPRELAGLLLEAA